MSSPGPDKYISGVIGQEGGLACRPQIVDAILDCMEENQDKYNTCYDFR